MNKVASLENHHQFQREVRMWDTYFHPATISEAQELLRVDAPNGLDLGGRTPEEIAVAILAEVIAVRRSGKGDSRSR